MCRSSGTASAGGGKHPNLVYPCTSMLPTPTAASFPGRRSVSADRDSDRELRSAVYLIIVGVLGLNEIYTSSNRPGAGPKPRAVLLCALMHCERFLSQFRNTRCVPTPKLHFLTPHSRKLGSVFEGPGRTDDRFEAICEWGLAT